MKILFISTMAGSAWGGSEILWSNMAAKLLDEGHEVIASVFDITPPTLTSLEKKGLILHKRRRTNFSSTFGKIKGKIISKTISNFEVRRLLKFKPDFVFFSQGAAFDLSIPIYANYIKQLNIPYYSYLSLNTEYEVLPYDTMTLQRTIFNNATKLFFASNRNKEIAQRQLCSEIANSIVIFYFIIIVRNRPGNNKPGDHKKQLDTISSITKSMKYIFICHKIYWSCNKMKKTNR